MTVATADQRMGDFSALNTSLYDPLTGNHDGTGREAFANATIPASRQSAITRRMQDLVPMPSKPGVSANLDRAGTQSLDRDNFDVKINWNKSDSLAIWGKYSALDAEFRCEPSLGEAQGPGLCSGAAGENVTVDQTSTIGFTKTISPTFLWDGTFGWTRHGNNSGTFVQIGTNFGLDVLGIPGTNGPDPRQSGIPRFSISGYETLGNPSGWQPNYYGDTTFSIDQNFQSDQERPQPPVRLSRTPSSHEPLAAGDRRRTKGAVRLQSWNHGSQRWSIPQPVQRLCLIPPWASPNHEKEPAVGKDGNLQPAARLVHS